MSKSFWENRYKENNTGWDIGQVSTPIQVYIDQIENKDLKILIPGAGFGHEAAYLFQKGFKNIYVIDIAQAAIEGMLEKYPYFPKENCFLGDYFEHFETYDLIIEQTLFCAINPELRELYAVKTHEILKTNGKLVGLLFDCHFEGGPPFGGNANDYEMLFSKYFTSVKISPCYNSISLRSGKEVFIQCIK